MKTKWEYQEKVAGFCWGGVIVGFIANLFMFFFPGVGYFLSLVGAVLCLIGCYNWAKYKGRSPLFCLWGLLAPIGFLGLALLKDKWTAASHPQEVIAQPN